MGRLCSVPAHVATWLVLFGANAAADESVDFQRDIRPILSDRCFACHGPDHKHREANLRLDQQQAAHEHAIVPGDSAGSELYTRVTTDDPDLRMPPPDIGKPLTAEEIGLLRQ